MSTATSTPPTEPSDDKKLKNRHITMITLGGIIGASLFVGSGNVIKAVGPAALISYAIGGLLVILVMRMLGEMAIARPAVGSFMEYARQGVGPWAGYLIGWLYWYFWVGVIAFDAVVGGETLHGWFPAVPEWVFSLAIIAVFTIVNLVSLRSFGEVEFWLASIKVVTIVVFLFFGVLFAFGLWPSASFSVGNLVDHGGFAPNGVWPIISGVALVIFSYFGTEIAVMAAAESEDPRGGVVKASNTVIWRVLLFYLGAVFVILAVVPWNELPDPESTGPFAYVFGKIFAGIFGPEAFEIAANVMGVVILTAVFSVLNSGIYSASRMFAALSDQGLAPKVVGTRTNQGVPWVAILASTVGGLIAVVFKAFDPESPILVYIMNSAGLVALLVYFFIALTQWRMRSQMSPAERDSLQLKTWLHPVPAIIVMIGVVAITIIMCFSEEGRQQVLLTFAAVGILLVFWPLARRNLAATGRLDRKFHTEVLQTIGGSTPQDGH